MKKLLIVALLLATGVVFSQTKNVESYTKLEDKIGKKYGTPDHAKARTNAERPVCADCEVEQVECPEDFIIEGKNKVDIRQMGDSNEAKGTQTGSSNMSLIRQDNSNFIPGGVGNLASSHQTGDGNGADIKQFGNDNKSRVWQYGDHNYAKQDIGDDGAKQAEGNLTYVSQIGDGNKSYQKQRYDNNEASAYQTGDRNSVVQKQSSGPNGSSGSVAFANQVGDDNAAQQNQTGSHNYASVYQSGNGNSSLETQTTTTDDPSICNISTVNQVGDDNKSCVTQDSDMGNNCPRR